MNNNQNFKNFSYINEIIKKYNIVEILKNYVNLTKKGQNFWCLCPFHGDKNPSLSVSPQKNIFKCFVCNAKGNAISFIMQFKKISYFEAVKEIIKVMNIDDIQLNNLINDYSNYNKEFSEIYEVNKQAAFVYHRTLFNKEAKECLKYLNDRKIDEKLIDFYELGYAPKTKNRDYLEHMLPQTENTNRPSLLFKAGLTFLNDENNYVDFFNDRLIIPIKNENGDVVGFSGRGLNKTEKIKYMNTKTTDIFKKENILFNFYSFDKSEYNELFVVEGYMDVFAFKRLGINNVVASMGTSFTDYQIQLIKKYKNINTIILCFDNDNAGREATKTLIKKLIINHFNVFVVSPYDSKYKDIDELSRSLSQQECLNIINKQISFIQYEVECLKKIDLSYKDKKIEAQKLINYINEFAYNPLLISDDLKSISDFSGVSIDEISNLIFKIKNNMNKNQKFLNKPRSYQKQSYSEIIFKNYINSESNNKNRQETSNEFWSFNVTNQIKIASKEQHLIISLIFNKALISVFDKYLGFINFNKQGLIGKVLRMILFYCQQYNDDQYNSGDIIESIFNSDEWENETEKKYGWNLIEEYLKKNYAEIKDSNKLYTQGLYLIKDIKEETYNCRIINASENAKQREKLKIEKKKILKEIENIINPKEANIN